MRRRDVSTRHLRLVAALLGVLVALLLLRLSSRDDGGGTIDAGAGFSLEAVGDPIRVDIIQLALGDTIRLERAGLSWAVDSHPADSAKIADLLPALDEARATELVARNPDNHETLGVSDSSGRRIELYADAGGPIAFHLGNRDRGRGGYYVRDAGAAAVYRLDGPLGGYLSRDRDGWRDRLIATLDTAALREILIRRGEDEATLVRGEGGWRVGDTPADTSTVQDLLRMLATLSASSTFPSDAEAAAADFTRPDGALDIFAVGEGDITARSLVLSLRLVETENGGGEWLVRRADDRETYGLTAASIRRLLPERSRLSPGEQAGG
jgi:hypothetical protein